MIIAILGNVATPALHADVAFGGDFALNERSLNDLSDTSAPAWSGFMGLGRGNWMFYLRHGEEQARLGQTPIEFRRRETSLEWTRAFAQTRSGALLILGAARTAYDVGRAIRDEIIWSGHIGVSGVGYLAAHPFLTATFTYRWPIVKGSSLEEELRFLKGGYQVELAAGWAFGSSKSLSIKVGYRLRDVDHEDRFFNDKAQGAFIAFRYAVAEED